MTLLNPPSSDAWLLWRARAARLLCVALLALPFSGCCARPDRPRPTPGAYEMFEEIQVKDEWSKYDDCIDYANFLVFGLLASAHGKGYREEVREPATLPPSSTPIPTRDPPLPR